MPDQKQNYSVVGQRRCSLPVRHRCTGIPYASPWQIQQRIRSLYFLWCVAWLSVDNGPSVLLSNVATSTAAVPVVVAAATHTVEKPQFLTSIMEDPTTASSSVLPAAVITTGCVTIVLASMLAYTMLLQRRHRRQTHHLSHESEAPVLPVVANVVDRKKYPGGAITIYYGTQTGTAESFSQSLEREGSQYGFLVHVVDLEDAIAQIKETYNTDEFNTGSTKQQPAIAERSIFITATYGEGEAPDGALPFCQWLQEVAGNIPFIEESTGTGTSGSGSTDGKDNATSPPNSSILSHVEYAVFGLGNTQYDHYNATGKFMDRALTVAGAQRILPLGLGDDNTDLEADFETWKDQQLWPALVKRYHIAADTTGTGSSKNEISNATNGGIAKKPKPSELPKCPFKIIYHNDTSGVASPNYNIPTEQIHSSSRHYFTAYECPITVVRELQTTPNISNGKKSPPTDHSTVHVELDIGSARALQSRSTVAVDGTDQSLFSYSTADNLGVLPENRIDVVERVAHTLGYHLDSVISVVASPEGGDWHGLPFPIPITIRECLLRYLDLTSAPRRSDLKRLSVFCTDTMDQKALLRMSTKEGRQEYKEKILDRYIGFVDLLSLCPSIRMPLEHLLHYCSPLQTRFFTISSSSSVHPKTVHLTVAVTKHERLDGSMFHGVCSTHLSNQENSTLPIPKYIRVFQRPSSFRLPSDTTKPIIMIGPGTGIAPMRALLQEREYQRNQLNQTVGSNTLYFGCKYQTQDYLYRDELETWAKPGGILTHLHLAFSRDQTPKVYVQDLLRQHATETWNLINDNTTNDGGGGAYIYVCGGVQMGHDVTEVLKEIVATHGNMTKELAKEYMTKLSQQGRFVQELWA